MNGQDALGAFTCTEGVSLSGVYYNRASSVIPGSELGLRAGPGGVSIGRFGWADEAGTVLNSRSNPADALGLVVVQYGDWRRIFWDETSGTWKIREGLNLTMLSASPGMLVRLANSGVWGLPVYADPIDGRPIAGYALGLEATPWTVINSAGAGGLSLISTWNKS